MSIGERQQGITHNVPQLCPVGQLKAQMFNNI